MSEKLYVGGLAWEVTNEHLKSTFETCGTVVEAVVITDRETGRSRGFGFVTMDSPASAQDAITALDGTEISGRAVSVNVARARGDRRPRW